MVRYRIPFSIYSSLIVALIFFSCGAVKRSRFIPLEKQTQIQSPRFVFIPGSSVFKTDIQIRNKRISGLMVFKQTATGVWRIVFINEIGMKFFDFRLDRNSFEIIECYPGLKRGKILSLLERDFRLLLIPPEHPVPVHERKERENTVVFLERSGNRHDWYLYYLSVQSLLPERTESYGFLGKTITISFSNYQRNHPYSFAINHNGIKLKLHFKILDH
jgi:hypothetical protein